MTYVTYSSRKASEMLQLDGNPGGEMLDGKAPDRMAWLVDQVMPHEPDVRSWFKRYAPWVWEVDDYIQEAYARIGALSDVEHITCGRAYFFTVVKNMLAQGARRTKMRRRYVVPAEHQIIERIADLCPSQERLLCDRESLRRVQQTVEMMTERCRAVFILRRVLGFSQRETAEMLAISENIVEKETARGLRLAGQANVLNSRDTSMITL